MEYPNNGDVMIRCIDTIRRWGHHLKRAARRFHAHERGASLTEFVITLPVFLVIFQGIMTLGELQQRSVAVKIEASHEMWEDAVTIQTSPLSFDTAAHISPLTAGGEALTDMKGISQSNSYAGNTVEFYARGKNVAQMGAGHYGESLTLLGPLSAAGVGNFNPQDSAENHLTEPFATSQVDDGVAPGLPSSPSGLSDVTQNWNPADITNGLRQAAGAGIRYGVAVGSAQDTRSLKPIGNYDMRASYDTLAAPRSMTTFEEFMSVGISRIGARERCVFRGTLGISDNQRLSNCSP